MKSGNYFTFSQIAVLIKYRRQHFCSGCEAGELLCSTFSKSRGGTLALLAMLGKVLPASYQANKKKRGGANQRRGNYRETFANRKAIRCSPKFVFWLPISGNNKGPGEVYLGYLKGNF